MSGSPELLEHVLDLLGDAGPVESRRMFGGWSLQRDGFPFTMVLDDLYLRVDDVTRPAWEAAGSEPFRYTAKGREVAVRRYYRAPPDALEDGARLTELVEEAVETARRDPTKRRR